MNLSNADIGFEKFEKDFYADVNTMLIKRKNISMTRFCKDVLDFLQSKYSDAYEFTIELKRGHIKEYALLKIKSGYFIKSITSCYMNYFYELYKGNEFIEERNQYLWQKELIDLIEGS